MCKCIHAWTNIREVYFMRFKLLFAHGWVTVCSARDTQQRIKTVPSLPHIICICFQGNLILHEREDSFVQTIRNNHSSVRFQSNFISNQARETTHIYIYIEQKVNQQISQTCDSNRRQNMNNSDARSEAFWNICFVKWPPPPPTLHICLLLLEISRDQLYCPLSNCVQNNSLTLDRFDTDDDITFTKVSIQIFV